MHREYLEQAAFYPLFFKVLAEPSQPWGWIGLSGTSHSSSKILGFQVKDHYFYNAKEALGVESPSEDLLAYIHSEDAASSGSFAMKKLFASLPKERPIAYGKGKWQEDLIDSIIGGRQECFRFLVYSSIIEHFDEAGSYVTTLANERLAEGRPLPIPVARGLQAREGTDNLLFCKVENHLDPGGLPYRDSQGHISFPRGRFWGVWWLSEIEASGASVLEIKRAWRYETSCRLEALGYNLLQERRLNKGTDTEDFLKVVGVKTVGMLGQSAPSRTVLPHCTDPRPGDVPIFLKEGVWCRYGGDPYWRPYSRPQTFSSLLSRARIKTLRALRSFPLDNVLAVHTDGLLVSRGVKPSSPFPSTWRLKWSLDTGDLGEWLTYRSSSAGLWLITDPGGRILKEARSGWKPGWSWDRVGRGASVLPCGASVGRINRIDGRMTEQPELDEGACYARTCGVQKK